MVCKSSMWTMDLFQVLVLKSNSKSSSPKISGSLHNTELPLISHNYQTKNSSFLSVLLVLLTLLLSSQWCSIYWNPHGQLPWHRNIPSAKSDSAPWYSSYQMEVKYLLSTGHFSTSLNPTQNLGGISLYCKFCLAFWNGKYVFKRAQLN